MLVKTVYVTLRKSFLHWQKDKQVNILVILNMHNDVSLSFKVTFGKGIVCQSNNIMLKATAAILRSKLSQLSPHLLE